MRELTIGKNDAGQRLDRFVAKSLPLLPPALLQKYIRIKRIKCNGQRCQRDQRLVVGDVLQLYINDEFFDQPREDNLFLTLFQPRLDILYEDENLMLLDKRPGLVVHADETERSIPSSTIFRLISIRNGSGIPGGKTPLLPLSATASTATPAASSLPPRTPRPCGSSTIRSGTGRSPRNISVSPWEKWHRPRENFLASSSRTKGKRRFLSTTTRFPAGNPPLPSTAP